MKRAPENPLTKWADAAFRQAAQKVVKRAKESGTPVIIWEDGRVVEKSAEEAEMVLRKTGTPAIVRKGRRVLVSAAEKAGMEPQKTRKRKRKD